MLVSDGMRGPLNKGGGGGEPRGVKVWFEIFRLLFREARQKNIIPLVVEEKINQIE